MANSNILVENSDLPGVRQAGQFNTKLPMSLQGTAANLSVGGNLVVTGTLSAGSETTTSQVITASSANAFTVGAAGTTNPAFNIDTSGGVTDVTGLNINSAAAASGVGLSVLSSATNENLTIDSKGSGSVTVNSIGTGAVNLNGSRAVVTATAAQAFSVGANGTTNPVLNVNSNTASVATGLTIVGAATGGTTAITVTDSGSNASLTVDGKGTGTVGLNTISATSGLVTIGNSTSLAGVAIKGATTVTSASASALAVGLNGATNPSFSVDSSVGSQVSGVSVTGAVTGGTVTVAAIDSGSNTSIKFDGKGTGTLGLNTVSTTSGIVTIGNGTSLAGAQLNGPLQSGTNGNTLAIMNTQTGGITIGNGSAGAISVTSGSTVSITGTTVTVNPGVVAQAGGKVASGIRYGSLAVGVYTGTGAPTFSAMNGSIYTDSDATSTTTRIYVNKSGAGTAGTTWTNLTTAA